MSHRSEIGGFLTSVYDGALRLDSDNERRSSVARTNVARVVAELRAWVTEPMRPLQGRPVFDAGDIRALNDPVRVGQREERVEAAERGFAEAARARESEVLSALLQTLPSESRTDEGRNRGDGAMPRETRGRDPSRPTASPQAQQDATETRARYVAGRQADATVAVQQEGFRPKPRNPLLEGVSRRDAKPSVRAEPRRAVAEERLDRKGPKPDETAATTPAPDPDRGRPTTGPGRWRRRRRAKPVAIPPERSAD